LYGGIGFVVCWKRGKERGVLESQRFCDPKANGTVGFVERPKKRVSTAGYFCPNQSCEYYGFTEEDIQALVGYGAHGRHEEIRDFKCQACGKKFTARRNTILYRLKRPSERIMKILGLLA
jgi:hypothetical protein